MNSSVPDGDLDVLRSVPRLSVTGLNKSFSTPVLKQFDLSIAPGEVHALVGGNGAGKSTLARILAGILERDSGSIELDGQPLHAATRSAAQAAGVTLVLQELNILPTLSVAENLFLSEWPARWGWIDQRELHRRARQALAGVGLEKLDPATPASRLGIGQQQMVELARAFEQKCRLLILDEPTAALTARETELLFERISQLRDRGVSVIYISHRMEELRRIADRVSVLRDGERVATLPLSETSTDGLVRLMVGHELTPPRDLETASQGPVVLRVRGLSRPPAVRDVSLDLHAGEILGLSGLVGAGRTELLRAVFGADPIEQGQFEVHGQAVRFRTPSQAVAAGLGFVPEDRKTEGLLLPLSLRVNATVSALKGLLVDPASERYDSDRIIRRLAVRCQGPEQAVGSLSGGNQQKIVLGRWLLKRAEILLLDEPTRGVDVPTREQVYALLRELAGEGRAILIASSDLTELMTVCDRIAVMSAGRIVQTFHRSDWNAEQLTAAAFRGHLNSSEKVLLTAET